MNLRDQLTSVRNQLAEEKSKTFDRDPALIARLEAQESDLAGQIEQEQATMVKIQQDHEDRVTQSTDDFNNEIDNLIVSNDMRLRDVLIDESFYQSVSIAIKGLYQAKVDGLSQQIADFQKENAELTAQCQNLTSQLQDVTSKLKQEELAHTYTKQSRDNAADLLKEAEEANTKLTEQLKAATAGVKTTNTEDEQLRKAENDAKIKLERTIYNVLADNPTSPRGYTAFKAANGEQVTFPYYAIKSYIVIPESEVPQFRQDNGIVEATVTSADSASLGSTDAAVQAGVTLEATFPEVPRAEAPEVPAVPAAVVEGPSGDNGQGQTLEERVAALEAHVFGFVKSVA